ncbi:MAG TPA: nucleotidyl transferase AbiEii/AbiGii toxin family protein [Spirochaetota bacterium]|nr:nucleotidyl transferase AbiEii/AbiGii toxin family protein [Spirochaetota bacterium]HOM38337.1 nucleotidyl transferase AbiEii/AbiGii toxin family protein [Spirochaetota bacterium]HPQ48445.1 nucleotidyl transferase AbiEii/AbiGii toxin family protein [Spirochaetota bacterium]
MILSLDKNVFQKEYFESIKGLSTPALSELVVYSLELVSLLSYYNLNFRFKGGNSILLLLDKPERFSIDVDIATAEKKEKITEVIEKIVSNSVFKKYEARLPKTKPWLPMISFNMYFDSYYNNEFIMLDIILESPSYPGQKVYVESKGIYRSNQIVEVPTISGLIGDKLLTIGPSTLGIPLGKNKEGQRLKHIFDISRLSRKECDVKIIKESFIANFEQESRIQQKSISIKEVIEDTILFCDKILLLEKPDYSNLESNTYEYEIAKGFNDFKKHIFSREYRFDDLKTDAKKVIELISYLKRYF